MEAKLKEYRDIRRRHERMENVKEKFEKSKEKIVNFLIPKVIQDMGRVYDDEDPLMENEAPPPIDPPVEEMVEEMASETSELPDEYERKLSRREIMTWVLYAILWLSLYVVFLSYGFGAVYFVVSVLIGICLNTSTRPKRKGEVSAYSVFNKNCTAIDGTLTPEQFEREIRYGAGTVRAPQIM